MKTLVERVKALEEEVARLIEVIRKLMEEMEGKAGQLIDAKGIPIPPEKKLYPKIKWDIGTKVEWR